MGRTQNCHKEKGHRPPEFNKGKAVTTKKNQESARLLDKLRGYRKKWDEGSNGRKRKQIDTTSLLYKTAVGANNNGTTSGTGKLFGEGICQRN